MAHVAFSLGRDLRIARDEARLYPALIGAVFALALLMQWRFGAFGDISWLITVCETWLGGGTPYVDRIETNPPAAIAIYMLPVWLAKTSGFRPEAVVALYGAALAGAMVACLRAILTRAGLLAGNAPAWTLLTLAAVLVMPGRTFDERDFFSALLALPFLGVSAARAAGKAPAAAPAALAGLGLGVALAIKPPYLTVLLALAPYMAWRIGAMPWARGAEFKGAAFVLGGYVAWTVLQFPAYLQDVVPTVAAAYVPVRETLGGLLANTGVILWVGGIALLLAAARRPVLDPAVAVPALASLGALAAFFVQGKGWLYHLYPALAFLALAGAALWQRLERDPRTEAAAAAAALATLAAAMASLPALPAAAICAIGARFALKPPSGDQGLAALAKLGAGALFGAACGLYAAPFPSAPESFRAALREIGPHPRIAAIAEGLGIGFPLVRNVDGIWAQRTQGLLMTAGARRQMDLAPGDAALAARLAPIIEADRDRLYEDLARNKPDAILVSRHGARFHDWAMTDPKLASVMAGYRFAQASGNPDWPVDLYLRDEGLSLRGADAP